MKTTLLTLLLLVQAGIAQTKPVLHTYHITGYASLQDGGDCTHPPITVEGKDRIDALFKAGISLRSGSVTVWTEQEWENFQKTVPNFQASCAPVMPKPCLDSDMACNVAHPVAPNPEAKQVTPLVGGMEIVPFVCNDAHPCVSWGQTIDTIPTAILSEKVTDGVYTLTFTDPSNHWKCITTNTQRARPDNVMDYSVAAFTVVCYDTSLSLLPQPVPPPAKEK